MNKMAVAALLGEAARDGEKYWVEISSSRNTDRFPRLGPPLAVREGLLDPRCFLGSLSSNWIPRVLVVRRGANVAGVVYLKEKSIAGIPVRLLYGDATLGNLVLAENGNREPVLRAALEKLLTSRRVLGLRLLLPPGGYETRVATEVAKSVRLQVCFAPLVWNHSRLFLPSHYDEFLNSLGYRARRNFRYYRRQFEAGHHEYIARLSMDELRRAASRLRTNCSIKSSHRAVQRIWNWLGAVDRPFACGLRSNSGEWLSVAAGFYTAAGATMLLQLNHDVEWQRSSLSVVLRGYLIESLIQDGHRELIFWSGIGGVLARYAPAVPGTGVYVDSPGRAWAIARSLVRAVRPRLPKSMREELDWVTSLDLEVHESSAASKGPKDA